MLIVTSRVAALTLLCAKLHCTQLTLSCVCVYVCGSPTPRHTQPVYSARAFTTHRLVCALVRG